MSLADTVCDYIALHEPCSAKMVANAIGVHVKAVRNAIGQARAADRLVGERVENISFYRLKRRASTPQLDGPRQWWQV